MTVTDTSVAGATATDMTVVDTTVADTTAADTSATDMSVADTATADMTVTGATATDMTVVDTTVADTSVADTATADADRAYTRVELTSYRRESDYSDRRHPRFGRVYRLARRGPRAARLHNKRDGIPRWSRSVRPIFGQSRPRGAHNPRGRRARAAIRRGRAPNTARTPIRGSLRL